MTKQILLNLLKLAVTFGCCFIVVLTVFGLLVGSAWPYVSILAGLVAVGVNIDMDERSTDNPAQ